MAKWKPPVDDTGNIWAFVQSHYGTLPAQRQQAIYTRLKARGAEFGDDPTGIRSGMIRLTPEMIGRLPEGWGAQGVRNVGRALPQYDETQWEAGRNSAGRYFLRPVTEMTGLNPAQVAAIRDADARSNAQQEVIRGAHNAAADTAAAEAVRLGTSLASIPGASAATQAASSAAAAAGTGQRLTDQARSDQTLAATRAAAVAALQAPAIRQMGSSAADAARTSAEARRAQTIAAYGASNAQAQTAQANLSARLRGQDMGLLGDQVRSGTQVSINEADNAQRDRESVRQTQVQLAGIDARVKTALAGNDSRKEIALLKERGRLIGDQNKIITQSVDLVVTSRTGANGQAVDVPRAQQRSQFVHILVVQGVPRARAIQAARAYFR